MGHVILFASGKGGVGKTTATAGVGFSLEKLGKKVLLIDADIHLRNLDLILGAQDKAIYDIQDVFLKNCEEERAILSSNAHPGLYFISAPLSLSVDANRLFDFILEFATQKAQKFDYVLVDCPAGLGDGVERLFCRKTRLVCVATPDVASVRDAEKVAVVAAARGVNYIRLLVNRVSKKALKRRGAPNIDDIIDDTHMQLIGIVPEDEAVPLAANTQKPICDIKRSKAKITFINIASRLDGKETGLYKKF